MVIFIGYLGKSLCTNVNESRKIHLGSLWQESKHLCKSDFSTMWMSPLSSHNSHTLTFIQDVMHGDIS